MGASRKFKKNDFGFDSQNLEIINFLFKLVDFQK